MLSYGQQIETGKGQSYKTANNSRNRNKFVPVSLLYFWWLQEANIKEKKKKVLPVIHQNYNKNKNMRHLIIIIHLVQYWKCVRGSDNLFKRALKSINISDWIHSNRTTHKQGNEIPTLNNNNQNMFLVYVIVISVYLCLNAIGTKEKEVNEGRKDFTLI